MQITRLYMDNSLRNYCHLIACEETGDAIVVDPLDADKWCARLTGDVQRVQVLQKGMANHQLSPRAVRRTP